MSGEPAVPIQIRCPRNRGDTAAFVVRDFHTDGCREFWLSVTPLLAEPCGDYLEFRTAVAPGVFVLVSPSGFFVPRGRAVLFRADPAARPAAATLDGEAVIVAGLEPVAQTGDPVDANLALTRYPDLDPVAGSDNFPIYLALRRTLDGRAEEPHRVRNARLPCP